MKKLTISLLLILFMTLLIVNTAFALEDSEVLLQTDSNWIVAGGASATISASITNISYSIVNVDFACTESDVYGDVTTKRVTAYPFITSFSSTKSGTAEIKAVINYEDDDGIPGSVTKTVQQKIDHAAPWEVKNITYSNEVTVGEVTSFDIRMTDIYGNLIDSKKEDNLAETPEYFDLYCSPADSYLFDGSGYTLNSARVYVNSDGVAGTSYMVSTRPGQNLINVFSIYWERPLAREITGIADLEPVSIDVSVNPNNGVPPYLPADGESKFYIRYYLTDKYGNPSGNRAVYISSSDSNYPLIGERTSNSYGVINISYGEKYQKGIDTVTAYSIDNASLSVQTDLQFDSTEPDNMILTANPEVMPSHEVAPTRTSAIRAKVIDIRGNPVENEEVSFSITPGAYPVYQTADPSLSAATATTDDDGQAIVYFTSGTFISDVLDPDYESAGSANCTVEATWNTTVKTILIEWKNYPYLSVETEVDPETVAVNGTVDVTIRLIGDGWALQPDPIDVMLSADRSGSMLKDYPDRMVSVMDAMKTFNSGMAEGRDRVGLTSFGTTGRAYLPNYWAYEWAGRDTKTWDDNSYTSSHYPWSDSTHYYSDYATLDLSLTTDHATVDTEIGNLVPMEGTPMRGGIYLALKELVDNSRTDAVKAVVVLSDGDYTTGSSNGNGDPLADGDYTYYGDLSSEEQNLAVYATNNGIKIYTIAYVQGESEVLRDLAEQSNGKYYTATSTNINDVYLEIAGALKTEAGVNTQMSLDFENIEVNNVSTSNSDSSILRYVYLNDVSTVIEKWNQTSTVIPRYTEDDTDDWSEDQSLDFDVGTIKLLETWETTFRLRVLTGGNINIFGPGSTITFNNATDTLALPKTYVTAVYDLNVSGTPFMDLTLSNLHSTNTGEIMDTLNLEWNILYTGESSAWQTLEYMKTDEGGYDEGSWIFFKSMPGVSGPMGAPITQNTNLLIRDFQPGNYDIRVIGTSIDTNDSVAVLSQPIFIGNNQTTYIKIE